MTTHALSDPSPKSRSNAYRAHRRALAHQRRANTAYEHIWRAGRPSMDAWEQVRRADRRAAYCYRQLCHAMGW